MLILYIQNYYATEKNYYFTFANVISLLIFEALRLRTELSN